MATYYFEGEQILAPLTINSNEPMFDADTISLKKQRSSQGAQRWELSFNIVSENPANILTNTIATFDQVNTMIMPQINKIEDSFTATGTITATGTQGSSSVTVSKTNADGIVPKGYFIKFNNHNKIYLLLNELNLSGTGTTSVNIYPNLVSNISNAALLTESSAVISYYRDISDIKGITYSDGVLSDVGTINIIEAL